MTAGKSRRPTSRSLIRHPVSRIRLSADLSVSASCWCCMRMTASVLVNADTVNDVALTQILERPEKMLRSDTEHRGANADAGIERDDFVVLQFLAEAIDQVNFCAHGPLRANRRSQDGFDDTLGRADLIGGLGDLEAAFGMRDDANSRMLAADALDLVRGEAAGHGRRAPPEVDARA